MSTVDRPDTLTSTSGSLSCALIKLSKPIDLTQVARKYIGHYWSSVPIPLSGGGLFQSGGQVAPPSSGTIGAIPGLQLWLDANNPSNNGSVPANGTNITTWVNRTGNTDYNAFNTNTSSPNLPSGNTNPYNRASGTTKIVTGIQNGLPGILLDKASFWSSIPAGTFSNELDVFIVYKNVSYYNGNNSGGEMLIHRNTLGGDYWTAKPFFITGEGGAHYGIIGNNEGPSCPDFYSTSTSMLNVNLTLTNSATSEITSYQNGNQQNLSGTTSRFTPNADSGSQLQIGRRADNALGVNAYIFEVLVFNQKVTPTNRVNIEGYLANKWGIQGSLPSNHLYAPTTTTTTSSTTRTTTTTTRPTTTTTTISTAAQEQIFQQQQQQQQQFLEQERQRLLELERQRILELQRQQQLLATSTTTTRPTTTTTTLPLNNSPVNPNAPSGAYQLTTMDVMDTYIIDLTTIGATGPPGMLLSTGVFAPVIGTTMQFYVPNLSNTQIFNIYSTPGTPSDRYTIIKKTNDSAIAGGYSQTPIVPTSLGGVFILGRAVANGQYNIATFGFCVGNTEFANKLASQTLTLSNSAGSMSVQYGFYLNAVPSGEPVTPNIGEMKLRVIVDGNINEPSSPFYASPSNSVVHVSATDRLTIAYDGTNMNYYVNGVAIHQAIPNPSMGIISGTPLYAVATLFNSGNTGIKQCAIVDFQMGTYDKVNVPGLIIGGGAKKRAASLKKRQTGNKKKTATRQKK